MKKTKTLITTAVFFGLMASLSLTTNAEEEIQKTFDRKKEIRFKLSLGDIRLKKSSDDRIHVHLVYSYEKQDRFEPTLDEKATYLYLRERYHGKNPRGYSKWTVAVPDETKIKFSTGTGDLYVDGLNIEIDGSTGTGEIEINNAKGEFDVSTGTGNLYISHSEGEFDVSSGTGNVYADESQGEFELSSGTGKVEIKNCKGNFEVRSGTGDVNAHGLTLEQEGTFSSGTEDVQVAFPEGDFIVLVVSSSTDTASLDMRGKSLDGHFEFTCHARKGRIISPVKFDSEEEYWEGDDKYYRKSFTKGKSKRKIFISTGTGTAQLKK
jgi:hypothetical protein